MAGYSNEILYAKNIDLTGDPSAALSNGLTGDGELWIGSTTPNGFGSHVIKGNIVSPLGSISVGYVGGNITLEYAGGSAGVFTTGVDATSGAGTNPVIPTVGGLITANGAVVAAGTNPVRTVSTAPNVYQIQNQVTQALAASDITKVGLCNLSSAAFTVDANGFVSLNGGGAAATSFGVQANTGPGTNPVVATAGGLINVNGLAVANHSVVLETRSRAANAYNVEIQYAATAAATDATKSGVSHYNSAHFSVDADGFVSATGSIPIQVSGDSGTATPSAGNINILGLSGSKTSASGSTIIVKSPPFSQVGATGTSVLNSGEFVTGAYTRTLPASAGLADGDLFLFACTSIAQLTIQAVGSQKIRIGSGLSSAAGTAKSNAIGDSLKLRFNATNEIFYCEDVVGTWTIA